MALIKDKSFRKYAETYAKDEQAFFKEYVSLTAARLLLYQSKPRESVADNDSFSNAFSKLIELGVPTVQFAGKPWEMGQK